MIYKVIAGFLNHEQYAWLLVLYLDLFLAERDLADLAPQRKNTVQKHDEIHELNARNEKTTNGAVLLRLKCNDQTMCDWNVCLTQPNTKRNLAG